MQKVWVVNSWPVQFCGEPHSCSLPITSPAGMVMSSGGNPKVCGLCITFPFLLANKTAQCGGKGDWKGQGGGEMDNYFASLMQPPLTYFSFHTLELSFPKKTENKTDQFLEGSQPTYSHNADSKKKKINPKKIT